MLPLDGFPLMGRRGKRIVNIKKKISAESLLKKGD
jgi:hypothetical protein